MKHKIELTGAEIKYLRHIIGFQISRDLKGKNKLVRKFGDAANTRSADARLRYANKVAGILHATGVVTLPDHAEGGDA